MPKTSLYAMNGGKPVFHEFITPIGRVVHCYHDVPQIATDDKTKAPIMETDQTTGAMYPKAEFKMTLAWPKADMDPVTGALVPLRGIAAKVRDEAWGPDAANDPWLNLQPFLRDGDNPEHNTKRREYLFGHVYLNIKGKAVPVIINGEFQKRYTGAPGLIGPRQEDILPADVYAGCYGRASGIMFGTEYMGKSFISTRLNNFQKGGGPKGDGTGERMGGGGRPDAKSQFDPLLSGPAPGAPSGGLANLL